MTMSKELAEMLARRKNEKRAATVLLKDVAPCALPIFALDHFDEFGHIEDENWAYLRWASADQVAALAAHLPSIFVRVAYRLGVREVRCFSSKRLQHALRELVTTPGKYFRVMKMSNGIRRLVAEELQPPTKTTR